jgi:hypothetical protein
MSLKYGITKKNSCYCHRFLIKGAAAAELAGGIPFIPQNPLSAPFLPVEIPDISPLSNKKRAAPTCTGTATSLEHVIEFVHLPLYISKKFEPVFPLNKL